MNRVFSEIKTKAALTFLLGGFALILVGLLVTFGICQNLFKYIFFKAPDLFETPASQYEDGKWYSCDNNILYDYFASDEYGRYYITNTNDGEYFGFYVGKKNYETADKITDDTYDYLDGLTDELSQGYLSGKGYIKAMDTTEKRYFEQFFDSDEGSSDDYRLVYYTYHLVSPMDLILRDEGENHLFYLIVGIVLIIGGLYMTIHFIFGGYKRSFNKPIKRYGILRDLLDQDMNYATNIGNAYIGSRFVLFFQSQGSFVIPYEAVVWAYVQVTTTKHTTYGIPTGTSKSYTVIIWDTDKKKNIQNVKSEEIGHQIVDAMYRNAPFFYTGFSNELANAADNGQYDAMKQAVAERRMHYINEQAPSEPAMNYNTNPGSDYNS